LCLAHGLNYEYMSTVHCKGRNKDRLGGQSGRSVQLTANFNVTHNLLDYKDHVNLSADKKNIKARNCEDVLDSSSDVPLEMKNVRINVIFFENVEMFNTCIRELHQHIKTIITYELRSK
jgi:hypothetical protein